MALSTEQRGDLRRAVGAAAIRTPLDKLVDRVAGTLTISAANGQGTIGVPADWGTDYLVVGLVLRSGPTAIVEARATTKSVGTCTITVVDSSGSGVDCSSTSAVLDYLVVRSV